MFMEPLASWARSAARFAKADARHRNGLPDDTGRGDVAAEPGHAAHHGARFASRRSADHGCTRVLAVSRRGDGKAGCYRFARSQPASATVISPVTFREAGPARNMTTSATSSGVEATCNGTMVRTVSRSLI